MLVYTVYPSGGASVSVKERKLMQKGSALVARESEGNQKSLFVLYADIPSSRWIELSLIDDQVDLGNQVTVLYCDGVLPGCTINWDADRFICNACIGRTKYHLSLLKNINDVRPLSKYDPFQVAPAIDVEVSPTYLRKLEEPCQLFGYGPLSSAVSFTRDMNFLMEPTRILAATYYATSLRVWSALSMACADIKPHTLYVHNGRLAEYQTTYLLAKALQIECVTHEICCPPKRFATFTNGRIHDRMCYQELIRDSTEGVDLNQVTSVAVDFFESKRYGRAQYQNFIAEQVDGLTDSIIDPNFDVVTIFTSSEDEFACLGPEWDNPIYDSQFSGVEDVVRHIRATKPAVLIVVRMHPNMAAMPDSELRPYLDLADVGVVVLEPKSKVHSYELIDRSTKVVTFGSTIGIESTYWGKPVIQIGYAAFDTLNVCYLPDSRQMLMNFLDVELDPLPKANTYPFAYTMVQGGKSLDYVDEKAWRYKGQRLLDMLSGFGVKLQGVTRNATWALVTSELRSLFLCLKRSNLGVLIVIICTSIVLR